MSLEPFVRVLGVGMGPQHVTPDVEDDVKESVEA